MTESAIESLSAEVERLVAEIEQLTEWREDAERRAFGLGETSVAFHRAEYALRKVAGLALPEKDFDPRVYALEVLERYGWNTEQTPLPFMKDLDDAD